MNNKGTGTTETTLKERNVLKPMEERFYDEYRHIQHIKNEESGNTYKPIIDFIKKEVALAVQQRDEEIYSKSLNVVDDYGFIHTHQLLDIIQGRETEKTTWVKNLLQQERERMWQDYKTQETMHNMMLDSLSIMCIKQFVKWREEHINLRNQDHD